MQEQKRCTSSKSRRCSSFIILTLIFILILIGVGIYKVANMPYIQNISKTFYDYPVGNTSGAGNLIDNSIPKNNAADLAGYPEDLVTLYNKNDDARQFVLEYNEKKDRVFDIDLSEYESCDSVPLLMQWDERWGYSEYAGNLMGLSGCGPACLSMAAIFLTGDTTMDPKWMAEFSTNNGYSTDGNGTSWTLISEGAAMLGLDVTEIPLQKEHTIANLDAGNPIICIMGPGDFTDSGHYIVLTGYEYGQLTVNDPNSFVNSSRTWTYEEIEDQILNLWALRIA